MDPPDPRVRKFVFDYLLEHTFAPAVEEIARGCQLDRAEAAAALQRLDAAHHLKLIEGTERILMAFPFSAVASPYRVTRGGGKRHFANCAWDAVAFQPMLQEAVEIDSFCHDCGNPIHFRLDPGRGDPTGPSLPTVFLALRAADWWTDIVRTCSNTMVFFESTSHLHRWQDAGNGRVGAALSVDQTVRLSLPIYVGKMGLGYRRPSTQEIQAHFRSLGLEGEFWKL